MTVTEIEEISGKRSRVFLDGSFAFVVYKGELRKYEIEKGKELEEEVLDELQNKVLPRRAKLRAMNLLKNRQYTEKQLTDKLLLGGYSQEIARVAVDYVKSYRYVDDYQYAYDYLACYMERRSRKELEQKLLQKGISRETIDSAAGNLARDGRVTDEEALILGLLEKKYNKYDGNGKISDREKQRIFAYFYRKGFSLELIRKVLKDTFA